jgi:thiol-disulfide isomerase/thioredoxin
MFKKALLIAAIAASGLAAAGVFSSGAGAAPAREQATAPEFTGINNWLNSTPLTQQQLRGKVVLVDFWTFDCINCIRTLPYVKSWHEKYKDQGLVVVGVHTPEYPFERKTENVAAAIKRFGITYPVAQDNQYGTWRAYNNQYWPAAYLIDKQGRIVYTHFGEGNYDVTEAKIRELLAQN